MVTTRPPKTIVKPTALGPVANTDTKLLIYGLFQKGRVLAQDGIQGLAGTSFWTVWTSPAYGGSGSKPLGLLLQARSRAFSCAAFSCTNASAGPMAGFRLHQPCAPPVGLSLATRSPGVGSQPCGAKYPRFCAGFQGRLSC